MSKRPPPTEYQEDLQLNSQRVNPSFDEVEQFKFEVQSRFEFLGQLSLKIVEESGNTFFTGETFSLTPLIAEFDEIWEEIKDHINPEL